MSKKKAKKTKGDFRTKEKFSAKGALAKRLAISFQAIQNWPADDRKKLLSVLATTLTPAESGEVFFRRVSVEVATAIQEGTVGLIYGPLSEWADGFKKLHATANAAGKAQVIDHGVPKGTKGSKVLLLDGGALEWEARIRGGGYDATRYEALLRAKANVAEGTLDEPADLEYFLAKYMKTRVVYEMDDERTAKAVSDKVITQEELDACKLPPSYSLQRPKKVSGIGEVIDVEASDE